MSGRAAKVSRGALGRVYADSVRAGQLVRLVRSDEATVDEAARPEPRDCRADDAPSFDDVREWVRTALREHFPAAECGPWVVEIWNDHIVYELEAKLYQVSYTLDLEAKSAAIVGLPTEVVRETRYVPAETTDRADAARVVRFDLVAPIHCDPSRDDGILATPDPATGFLYLDGRLTRTGVFRYRDADGNEWGELRDDAEVFAPEALDSFRSVVVTNDHPSEFVTRKNVKDVQAGHLGSDVRRDGAFVIASIVVTDPVTILDIQDGKRELSCGYTAEVVADAGEIDGQRYDMRQTNIQGNHVAIVDVGRAGPDCALMARPDGAAAGVHPLMSAPERRDAQQLQQQEKTMKLSQLIKDALSALKQAKDDAGAKKVMADAGAKLKKANELKADQGKVAEILELLTAAADTGNAMLMEAALTAVGSMLGSGGEAPAAPAPGESDAMSGEEEEEESDSPVPPSPPALDSAQARRGDSDENVKLRAKLDAIEAQRKRDEQSFAQRVSARVALEAQARAVSSDLGDLSTKSDEAIMRAVVLAIEPEAKARLDANKDVAGYLKATFDAALELSATRARHADELVGAVFDAHRGNDAEDPDAIYADFLRRRDEKSKTVTRAAS